MGACVEYLWWEVVPPRITSPPGSASYYDLLRKVHHHSDHNCNWYILATGSVTRSIIDPDELSPFLYLQINTPNGDDALLSAWIMACCEQCIVKTKQEFHWTRLLLRHQYWRTLTYTPVSLGFSISGCNWVRLNKRKVRKLHR